MITVPIPTRRALLVWQRPLDQTGSRDRYPVAELVQTADGIDFRYLDPRQLESAEEAGFSGYPGLPVETDGLSRIASDVLMRRLPPRDRADFPEFLERFGLPRDGNYTDLTLLAYTGARLTSDSFSVCETFDGFEGAFSYVFDVAGNRHYFNYNELAPGQTIYFEHEPMNSVDPNAIRLAGEDNETVGYINRLQALTVRSWLINGSVDATVFRVNGRLQYPRLFVQANIVTNTRVAAA